MNLQDRQELEDLRNIVFTMFDDNAGRTPPIIMYGPVTLDNLRLMMKYGGDETLLDGGNVCVLFTLKEGAEWSRKSSRFSCSVLVSALRNIVARLLRKNSAV